jgi:hypothetical protein
VFLTGKFLQLFTLVYFRVPFLKGSWLAGVVLAALVSGSLQPLYSEITVVSYHLRDRAVSLDSLVMRKRAIFGFKSSVALSKLKGRAVAGELSYGGRVMARDTTYFFDQAAGNLGFSLPFEIPDGAYQLNIRIVETNGTLLDSYSGSFDRKQLRPYFMRGINFWDFTKPYAHFECSGYGELTYRFRSMVYAKPRILEVSARMLSDNSFPVKTKLSVNGVELGVFELPAAERGKVPQVVTWRVDDAEVLAGLAINPGKNSLEFAIPKELNPKGMGIRIYAQKNTTDPAIEDAVPVTIRWAEGVGKPWHAVVTVPVWGEEGEHITTSFSPTELTGFTEEKIEEEQEPLPLNNLDVRRGYVVFRKPYLSYVYPWTIPTDQERVESLDLRMARNDFEPLNFAVYPIRELGETRVSVDDLQGPGGSVITSDNVVVHVAKSVKVRTRATSYRLIPRLLERTDRACLPVDYTTRFWLTLHADNNTAPGIYRGLVRISPEKEQPVEVPLSVEVLPITLDPVPGLAYSMFMTYEFFELESKDWNDEQRAKIFRDGVNVFRDFKNHGMTTVDVATPYYFQWNADGTPRMEHFRAMIRAAKEVDFPEPLHWYFAHYLQASKKQHPGSVLLYDPKIHPRRARKLVETALKITKELDGPPLYFVPIDEPRIAARQKITLELLKSIKKIRGIKTQVSTDIGGKLLDIENNSQRLKKPLGPGERRKKTARQVWEYCNSAVNSLNPGYSRFMYGYYTWRQDLDGMNSWGFNTAENSRGHPYEDLDHERSDWNLAYPHPGGPLPTPNWEAVREGIEDVRYIYQLEKLVRQKAAAYPEETAAVEKYLDEIRARCDLDERTMIDEFGEWTPEAFDSTRARIVSWILKLKQM